MTSTMSRSSVLQSGFYHVTCLPFRRLLTSHSMNFYGGNGISDNPKTTVSKQIQRKAFSPKIREINIGALCETEWCHGRSTTSPISKLRLVVPRRHLTSQVISQCQLLDTSSTVCQTKSISRQLHHRSESTVIRNLKAVCSISLQCNRLVRALKKQA